MFKKNSIFFKILGPVIVVMLFQVGVVSLVLFVNGTIHSLDDNAIETMQKNTENRALSLEDVMVFYWSNLDKLEMDAQSVIGGYLSEHGVTMTDVLGDYQRETEMLDALSESLISALRYTSSTGAFIYFVGDGYAEREVTCNGLYYRDQDPISTPADHSDLLFLRGYIDIARKDKIQLDSLWNEVFTFAPQFTDAWKVYSYPQIAARDYPLATPVDQSYWSRPRLLSQHSAADATRCITYSRPLFYEGRLVAIAGTEVQLSYLEKYYPASDFDSAGKSGYMLIEYPRDTASDGDIECNVYSATGSYIKRLLGSGDTVTLSPTHRSGVYSITSDVSEGVQVVIKELHLYNSNAPFSNSQWALAAIGTDSVLFASSRNVSHGILYSSAFALIAGTLMLGAVISVTTKPFISLANQIERSDTGDPIVVSRSDTYEIVLLCSTINAMRERRNHAEALLREERERYLIALESAADTFMEYDVARDSFMLYYFEGDAHNPQLHSTVIERFTSKLDAGEFFHPDDVRSASALIDPDSTEPVEVRAKASFFAHIEGAPTVGDYHWFLIRASRILDGEGNLKKVIGTLREITAEKLAEFARIETTRRDATTGLYNAEYGMQLIKDMPCAAGDGAPPFALCFVHVDDFDRFEAYYGRVFGGVLMLAFSRELRGAQRPGDVAVRLDNDDFLLLMNGADKDAAAERAERLIERVALLYAGENADLSMSVSIGVALRGDGGDWDALLDNARRAARYAAKGGGGHMSFYADAPHAAAADDAFHRDKPVSVTLDISRDSVVSFVFEYFERTSDVHSAINLLLPVLGDIFELRRVVICAYDADFGADHVAYQWHGDGAAPFSDTIGKVSFEDLSEFDSLLDDNGALLYNDSTLDYCGEGVRRLLCAQAGERMDAYCCVMYENNVHSGRILFVARERGRGWMSGELLSMYEITKIVAAHLSIEKSHYASRAKSEFLSRVSHEIRTPMNAIIGMTDIAKNSIGDAQRLDDCLTKIDFSAKHLLALINDVLEMSRIESGKLQMQDAPFSLRQFAEGIDTLMRPPIEKKRVSLDIRLDCAHYDVISDEYRLRQVLVNLLGNAGKFTDAGGTITFTVQELELSAAEAAAARITAEPDGDQDGAYGYFRFAVRDTGIGISQEDQPNVFRAFEQAGSSSLSQQRQGTGLGLAISGNIISALGSKIELASKLGEGSEFSFTIRMRLCEEQHDAVPDVPCETDYTGCFAGRRALLAEDNEINIEIASYILGETGFDIDVALNGEEAVDKFLSSAQGYYDIIFMDIQMPVMDGLTATRNIRKHADRPDARTIPIIAMTANAFDEDMKKSIESGMNGHVAKPIDSMKLCTLLKRLLP